MVRHDFLSTINFFSQCTINVAFVRSILRNLTCFRRRLDILLHGSCVRKMVPQIQNSEMKVNLLYAVLSYLMILGLFIFVLPNVYIVQDSKKIKNTFLRSALYGGIFGIVLYGVCDLPLRLC